MLGANKAKNRNKKGLALSAESAKPGTRPPLAGLAPSPSLSPMLPLSATLGRTPSLASSSSSIASGSSNTLNVAQAPPRSNRSSLSDQFAHLELGIEFKLDLRAEDLEVLVELGSGNGGTVSKCLHVPTKAIMAKKVIHIQTSQSARKQILRELQIMHDCSGSPYIVTFYGAFLSDPYICMAMEYMDKTSLDSIYKKVGPIPEPILAKIAFAVVSGLHYLYDVHKIMHRDVKPSNILLNSVGQIKICDFGVSGELINSVADTFVGTSTYMSPERISGDPYSVKSDVWSLGISIVELAIGRFPFSNADDEEDEESDDEDFDESVTSNFLDGVDEGDEDEHDEADMTLSPARPHKKGESVQEAERKRKERREAQLSGRKTLPAAAPGPRTRTISTASSRSNRSAKKKGAGGVSLSGGGGAMSILELLQYIVNEPAPKLPKKGRDGIGPFSPEMELCIDAMLRKEPVGWDVRRKGELPKEQARPTPRELLEYEWLVEGGQADTDVELWAQSIP